MAATLYDSDLHIPIELIPLPIWCLYARHNLIDRVLATFEHSCRKETFHLGASGKVDDDIWQSLAVGLVKRLILVAHGSLTPFPETHRVQRGEDSEASTKEDVGVIFVAQGVDVDDDRDLINL